MAGSTPHGWCWVRRSLIFVSAATAVFTLGTARAQQSASHAGAAAGHSGRIAAGAHPGPVTATPPARASVPVAAPRTVSSRRWPRAAGQSVRVVTLQNSFRPVARTPIFFEPFSFGEPFGAGFGMAGSVSRFDRTPLGFGLWPACDSAGTPGVFWTVGPCFGMGDYTAESAASAGNGYLLGTAPPSAYILPLIFAEAEAPSPAAEENPSAAAPAPTMLLYLTDGRTIAATDWWVAHGRLQYVTDSGAKDSVDLSHLDLEQTIKQNETRGLIFHLRFTPPSERP